MAWESHRLGYLLTRSNAGVAADARALLDGHQGDFEHFVYAPSRMGSLHRKLALICEQANYGKGLYLLEDACLLEPTAIPHQAMRIEALLEEIRLNPGLIVEALKEPYQPHLILHARGFEPQPAELVYGADVTIKDGWVYEYTAAQVLGFLNDAGSSQTPCPPGDDDGESLAYVFTFLKSHLTLLRTALNQDAVLVVYGELNT